MRGMVGAGGAVFVWLVLASAAFAQTPAQDVYGGAGDVQDEVSSGGAGVAGGALPFTGLDLALMVVAAALLIAAGLTMRRLGRAKS